MTAEHEGSGPLSGVLDTGTLVLLGHSYGGVAGLYAIMDQCVFPFCTGTFSRPDALAGGAFYGTNMKPPLGSIPPVPNDGLPLALVQGSVDGKAAPADGETTFDQIEDPPKLFATIEGANHYGICDQDNPPGAQADPNAATIEQATAVETAARWSALFLRATVLEDAQAAQYISTTGDPADPNVEVTWQP
jgi:predicted dienelactone hydrolase